MLRSIGYKSLNIDECVPFDHKKGVVPNQTGRVTETKGRDVSSHLCLILLTRKPGSSNCHLTGRMNVSHISILSIIRLEIK